MKITFLLISILFVSCAPKNIDPDVARLLNVREVVIALGTVQSTAIQLNKSSLLSDQSTRMVVDGVGSALKTIQQLPNGWQQTVIEGLNGLETQLPETEREKVVPYIEIVKTVIARIQ